MKVAHNDNKYNSVLTYLYCSKFLWLTDRILENRILTMLIRNIRLSCKRKKIEKAVRTYFGIHVFGIIEGCHSREGGGQRNA